ncbi:zinc finger protein CONSTANS-LIKE 1-like [Phalaenopsis equestris]|uniref:zinc finger protein CONSTANS-LIKE 1-like n=1 Tax=Phalaenopsis equestris TaxID=78828 RepID=UPI0009E55A15|nr:zinc finger protein CONSTANS-LIKE 1-like [Phalaenopsis equestris]
MKGCELCDRAARMYCESDQASLCWECDAKVHGANFLVARHPRVLLCRSCQAPTPWRASGARLSPTFSVCESCTAGEKALSAGEGEEGQGEAEIEVQMMEEDEEDLYDDEFSDSEVEEEEEEGENQVVPWTQTPPPPASSSSGEDSSWNGRTGSPLLHRMRENADLVSQHDFTCSNSHRNNLGTAAVPLVRSTGKDHRRSLLLQANPSSFAIAGAANNISIRSFHSTFDVTSPASRSPSI